MRTWITRPYLLLALLAGVGLVSGLALSGCAHLPSMLPTAEQLVAAGEHPGDGDLDALTRGRALAVTQCIGCHRFYWPHEYSPQAWPGWVRNMGNQQFLTPRQIGDITRYMVAASRATRVEHEAAAPDAPLATVSPAVILRGQSLARANCKQCHRLRQPQEFAADDWPAILRSHAPLVTLSEDEFRAIGWYYIQGARQGR